MHHSPAFFPRDQAAISWQKREAGELLMRQSLGVFFGGARFDCYECEAELSRVIRCWLRASAREQRA
jgi:hypothetical protein